MLHADAGGSIPPHRMPYQASRLPGRNRAIMRIHVGDHVLSDEAFKIAGRNRTRIHRSVMPRLGVRQDYDRRLGALCKSALNGLSDVDFLAPLLSSDPITVQRVDHRI